MNSIVLTAQYRRLAAITMAGVLNAMCGGSAATSSPTAPTPSPTAAPAPVPAPVVSLQSLRVTPNGVGVLYNTAFQFDAVGTFPAGTQFAWQFGDGTSETTTSPTSSHVYVSVPTLPDVALLAWAANTTALPAALMISRKL